MTDISAALRELAEPRPAGDRVKRAIGRAAKRCGFAFWRTFDLWYGKARRVEPHERESVFAALDKKRKEEARNELHELRVRMARLESLLAQSDPDFHRETIDQTRHQLRRVG